MFESLSRGAAEARIGRAFDPGMGVKKRRKTGRIVSIEIDISFQGLDRGGWGVESLVPGA